jgi:hypothetical protein
MKHDLQYIQFTNCMYCLRMHVQVLQWMSATVPLSRNRHTSSTSPTDNDIVNVSTSSAQLQP